MSQNSPTPAQLRECAEQLAMWRETAGDYHSRWLVQRRTTNEMQQILTLVDEYLHSATIGQPEDIERACAIRDAMRALNERLEAQP